MTTTIPVLRSKSRGDLLALPSFMFGFHPAESIVVLGLRGSTVCFSARLDADWFTTHFDQAADQVLNAAANIGRCQFVLLGYSADLELASISVEEAAAVVGPGKVIEALVTDGASYWSLIDGEGPHPFSFSSNPITAEAVFKGVNIFPTREEAVAPVIAWDPPRPEEVEAALGVIAKLGDEGGMILLERLAEADPPVTGQVALELACLLLDEDRGVALLTQLNGANAELIWCNLAAARRVTPKLAEATVLALLGVASWLAGRGAQATACIEQLEELDPHHPIGQLLARVHQGGIPPQLWDE